MSPMPWTGGYENRSGFVRGGFNGFPPGHGAGKFGGVIGKAVTGNRSQYSCSGCIKGFRRKYHKPLRQFLSFRTEEVNSPIEA
ncbi:hypothetical protein ACFX2A_024421 [Malus domestica]